MVLSRVGKEKQEKQKMSTKALLFAVATMVAGSAFAAEKASSGSPRIWTRAPRFWKAQATWM
jgi:hypothetical protein